MRVVRATLCVLRRCCVATSCRRVKCDVKCVADYSAVGAKLVRAAMMLFCRFVPRVVCDVK